MITFKFSVQSSFSEFSKLRQVVERLVPWWLEAFVPTGWWVSSYQSWSSDSFSSNYKYNGLKCAHRHISNDIGLALHSSHIQTLWTYTHFSGDALPNQVSYYPFSIHDSDIYTIFYPNIHFLDGVQIPNDCKCVYTTNSNYRYVYKHYLFFNAILLSRLISFIFYS